MHFGTVAASYFKDTQSSTTILYMELELLCSACLEGFDAIVKPDVRTFLATMHTIGVSQEKNHFFSTFEMPKATECGRHRMDITFTKH